MTLATSPSVVETGAKNFHPLQEKVRVLYQHMPMVLVSNLMIAALLVTVLWEKNPQWMPVWGGLVFLLVGVRTALFIGYFTVNPEGDANQRWGVIAAICSGLAGLLWGGNAYLLLLQSDLNELTLILLVLSAMGAGVVSLLTPYLPAFYAYFYLSLLPYAGLMFSHGTTTSMVMGCMVLVYVAALTFFARHIHRNFILALHLRQENVALVQELMLQKEDAIRSSIAKSRFLAAASHDLRQPMHALGLFVETLRERILYPDLRRIVDNIGASVEAMNGLFNSLLDISKLDAGVIQPAKTTFSLHEIFHRIQIEHENQALEKGFKIHVVNTSLVVHSDPGLLERIVRNFVSNAVRYTKTGRIVVGCRRSRESVLIEVWDTGVGIPQDKLQDIFQEFYQLDNPERDRSKGLGLGLAIVDRLAHLLGHTIEVRSKLGLGSVFRVRVPRGQLVSSSHTSTMEGRGGYVGFAHALVLFIDDEAAIVQGMMGLLEGWGCDVIAATSGEEMKEKLLDCARTPDVIISDYRLRHGENGIEVIRSLQEEFNDDIPGILITGDTAPDRLQEARASGFELLHKPLQPAKLRALLVNLLQHRQASP